MSTFLRLFADKRSRTIGLVVSLSVAGLSFAVIIATIIFQSSGDLPSSVQPKKHADIAAQPMQTFANSLNTTFPDDDANFPTSKCPSLANDWLAKENLQTGIPFSKKEWQDLSLRSISGSALWVNKTSVNCGDELQVHASLYGSSLLDFESGVRSIQAIRIGWYQGAGAREIWNSGPLKLKQYGVKKHKNATRLIDTNWPTTLTVRVGQDWVPGFYLIVTKSPSGIIESAAPLVVHSPAGTSKLALMHSFITWNIYNSFGGASGYFGAGATKAEKRLDRTRVSSFDRPMVASGGFSIHRDAISTVQFLEKNSIAVDQYSDVDIDNWPSLVSKYNGVVLAGHAEYFTRRMMDSMIAARNSGINIAILGGNTAIWQTRLTESKFGKDRRAIIYRKATEDPITDPDKISIKFEDKRVNYPATLFTAALTTGVHVYGNLQAKTIPSWLKIPKDSSINGISSDSEVEAYAPTPAAPPKVGIIFSGNLTYRDPTALSVMGGVVPVANSLWYTTPSGSAVFNAGVMTWACDLIDTCAYSTVDAQSRQVIDDVTLQVLKLWQIKEVGKTLKN